MATPLLLFGFVIAVFVLVQPDERARRQACKELQHANRMLEEANLDAQLTEKIYAAVRAAGFDPEYEMERLSESVVYPIEITYGGYHTMKCRCDACQIAFLPPEKRTNITVEFYEGRRYRVAHSRTCACEKCRSKLGIDAERALELSHMLSTSTTLPSDTEMQMQWFASWIRSNGTEILRLN